MSRGSSIKSLAAAVRRLEKAAQRGPRHCAYCRSARRVSPGPDAPEEEVLRRRCEFYHSELAIHLPSQAEQREVFRMLFTYTLEDTFTDPKAHAFILWWTYMREHSDGCAVPDGNAKGTPPALAGAKPSDELERLADRRFNKLLAKYGEPFPEHSQLIAAVEEAERRKKDTSIFVPGLKELWRKRTDYLICCELEKIIWGGTIPETEAVIERLSLEIDELVRSYAEAEERRRKESRVKNLELVNRLRAQQGLPPRPKSS
jgi:hypothetical protein